MAEEDSPQRAGSSGNPNDLRAYVEYFRDIGVHDFYRRGEPVVLEEPILPERESSAQATASMIEEQVVEAAPAVTAVAPAESPRPVMQKQEPTISQPDFAGSTIPKPISFDKL